jgi:hypothetical protein
MVEKDIEYSIKSLILDANEGLVSITNEFSSDGIVRYNKRPVAILEFKLKRNFANETTLAQVLCQAMCYYCKLISKEQIDYSKPFYLIIGDENEIVVINLHKMPNNWLLNKKWGEIAPSRAGKEKDLMDVALSMIKIVSPLYYKYENAKDLSFGFKLIFSTDLN